MWPWKRLFPPPKKNTGPSTRVWTVSSSCIWFHLVSFSFMVSFSFISRWWFQIFFMFTPIWGRWTQFDSHFSKGLVQPPTRFGEKTSQDLGIIRINVISKSFWDEIGRVFGSSVASLGRALLPFTLKAFPSLDFHGFSWRVLVVFLMIMKPLRPFLVGGSTQQKLQWHWISLRIPPFGESYNISFDDPLFFTDTIWGIWVFRKIGVHPFHTPKWSFLVGKPHGCWGNPPFLETSIYVLMIPFLKIFKAPLKRRRVVANLRIPWTFILELNSLGGFQRENFHDPSGSSNLDGNLSGWLVVKISIQHELVVLYTLQGTNISHPKAVGKMNFLFNWWDMLVSWRVYMLIYTLPETKRYIAPEKFTQLKTQKEKQTSSQPSSFRCDLLVSERLAKMRDVQ